MTAALLSGLVLLIFIIASAAIVFDNMMEEADFVLAERSETLLAQFKAETPSANDLKNDSFSAPLNAELAEVKLIRYFSPEIDWATKDPDWQLDWVQDESWLRKKKRTIWDGLDVWRTYAEKSNGEHGILLAMDLYEIRREVWRMCRTFLNALPLTLLFVGIGGWWTSRRIVEPLDTLATAMERVADGDLTERLELTHARDLIDRLSRIFNQMTRRLQSSFRQANRFSSDASHELRTPLTILRGQLENALQKADGEHAVELAGLLDQTERLRGIIDGLLLLSRSDAGKLSVGYDEQDLSKLATDVIQDFESALSESGITLNSKITPDLNLRGDPGLLRQALGNLISNAEKFNLPENGWISIELKPDGEELWLSVENSGEPIAPDQKRDVFRRFFRASGDRESPTAPGTGLGLSIVEAVAEAHGGRAWCEPRSASNRFVLAFPRSEGPSM